MEDRYLPDPPDTAQCPRCATVATDRAPVIAGALKLVTLEWTCVGCGQNWDEVRHAAVTDRHWE